MSAEVSARTQKARALAQERGFGVLATNLAKQPGYPFASVVNYVLDGAGRPVLLLSALAVHTRNLGVDPRAALFVFAADAPAGTMAAARLNLIGNIERVSDNESELLRTSYLERHPDASEYIDFGDFGFYRLSVTDVYFVAGFGDMGWNTAAEWSRAFVNE